MDLSHRSATLDWTAEDEYWRTHYRNRPYVGSSDYEFWQPAYRYGYDAAQQYPSMKWQDVEAHLRAGWDQYKHRHNDYTTWEQMKDAVRDAWDHIFDNR